MAGTFQFEIVTPERTVFASEVRQVSISTQSGEITILPYHIPIVSVLVSGVLHLVTASGDPQVIATSGGFVEVHGQKVTILADTAERAEEIDEARAEEARERARNAMANRESEEAFASAAAALERELARLHAVRRWKGHNRPGPDHTPNPVQ
jgi:F-type H+-transporting ATPase subunit epsilon